MADGLPEMQALFGELMGVPAHLVTVGNNSSLNIMFDTVSCAMTHGFSGLRSLGPAGKSEVPLPGTGI